MTRHFRHGGSGSHVSCFRKTGTRRAPRPSLSTSDSLYLLAHDDIDHPAVRHFIAKACEKRLSRLVAEQLEILFDMEQEGEIPARFNTFKRT
ncbi:hypothetical protein [Cupriavidus sp. AcVe19-6a]|uniref:hypothetical protein n=1 Tax=Cupriavidus sp. AcVe19-6a TaxID=2821358 RepID=UPI001AE6C8CC|nr:hypothetical protein [Cupriavidus sp. AcVe19-6a]MBP0637444.1 hypothetical protein [Cupriavidus sp. AcVe19-6a]